MLKFTSAMCAALAVLVLTNPAAAQQNQPPATTEKPSIKRIPLQRFDVPGTAYETVIGIAEIAPNASIGRHTHPGPESGYVFEGSLELMIDGEPPRLLNAGGSYKVPPRAIHDARTGPSSAKVIATYVVEKWHPLASAVK